MFRGRSTLIYLVVALGLVCYVTFIDKKIPGTAEEARPTQSQLFKFDQDDVTGLEVSNVHGSFVFQKKNDHWEITSPVHTLADDATVAEVIGEIAYAQPQRTIPLDGSDAANEKNLKEWGLDPAAERAIIHLKDRSLELLVGRKVAINDSVYARTSGHHAPVRVVPDTVKIALDKTLSDFRSRNVFDFALDHVTRIATRVANTATTPGAGMRGGPEGRQVDAAKAADRPRLRADVNALLGQGTGPARDHVRHRRSRQPGAIRPDDARRDPLRHGRHRRRRRAADRLGGAGQAGPGLRPAAEVQRHRHARAKPP